MTAITNKIKLETQKLIFIHLHGENSQLVPPYLRFNKRKNTRFFLCLPAFKTRSLKYQSDLINIWSVAYIQIKVLTQKRIFSSASAQCQDATSTVTHTPWSCVVGHLSRWLNLIGQSHHHLVDRPIEVSLLKRDQVCAIALLKFLS